MVGRLPTHNRGRELFTELTMKQCFLPTGQQVYGYTPSDRAHGRSIWILGTLMLGTLMFIILSALNTNGLE